MLLESLRLLERAARWLLRNRPLVTGVVFFVRKALPARRVRTEETPAAAPAAVPAPDNVVWLPVGAARAGANEAIEAESEEQAAEPASSRG